MSIELSGIWTLALALVTIEIGKWFNRRLAWLDRSNVPPAVSEWPSTPPRRRAGQRHT